MNICDSTDETSNKAHPYLRKNESNNLSIKVKWKELKELNSENKIRQMICLEPSLPRFLSSPCMSLALHFLF